MRGERSGRRARRDHCQGRDGLARRCRRVGNLAAVVAATEIWVDQGAHTPTRLDVDAMQQAARVAHEGKVAFLGDGVARDHAKARHQGRGQARFGRVPTFLAALNQVLQSQTQIDCRYPHASKQEGKK